MSRSILLLRVACIVALALFLSPLIAGQKQPTAASNKGSITGTVTDPDQTVIPGATVVLSNRAGKLETKTDPKGVYAFSQVNGGYCDLTITAPNFATKTLEYVNVTPDDEATVDVTLEPVAAKSEAKTKSDVKATSEEKANSAAIASEKGAVNGTVTDQTQAVIPGATATLTNKAGFKQEIKTNEKGTYAFNGLEGGTYDLAITAPNFTLKTFDGVKIAGGLEITLDATLEPASASTEVNVEASTLGQVEVENATLSGTIPEKEITTYGLNGRNFSQLITMAPGVSNQTGQDEAKVGVQGSVKYSVNGGRVEYNSFEIDGSDVLNTGLNGAASTLMVYPSLDAIQEVKVLTSNYGAQFGRTASGVVQVTTKSGTNNYHGSLYDFVRNEAFNARNYFDTTTSAPLYRRQDFGGTIGGLLTIPGFYNNSKKKTFFFFSEEARLEKTPTEYNQAVPSFNERGLLGSALQPAACLQGNPSACLKNLATSWNGQVTQVFDFSDVCPVAGTTLGFSRQQYPDCPSLMSIGGTPTVMAGNQLLPAYVNKNALLILNSNLIPLPNSATGCNYSVANLIPSDPDHCYDATVSPSTYWREELFRIDHNPNDNTKLSFRYIHDAWDTTVLVPQWSYQSQNFPGAGTFPSVENRFVGPGTNLVASLTNIISPTLVNSLVLSYANSNITLADQNGPGNGQYQLNPSLYQSLVSSSSGSCGTEPVGGGLPQCAMGYIFNNGFGDKMPGIAILGSNAAYGGKGFAVDPSYMPWRHTNPTYSLRDDVSRVWGKHTVQIGLQYTYAQRNQDNNVIGGASGDVQGLLMFNNLAHSTGNSFADFLTEQNLGGLQTGYIQSYTQDSGQGVYYQRYQIAEPYFQDNWKATSHLTLNLGLRVSLFGTYSEKNNNAWNWVPSDFNASRFSVDPNSGVLLYGNTGAPVQFNSSTFQFSDSSVIKDLGLVQCGVNGTPSSCMKGHVFNPAPRIGFAWDPKGNGKTSIRGGYGIFFEHGTGNESNTGSLEASAPVVLSMTQPTPLNYACIGNAAYNVLNSSGNSICSPASGVAPTPANSVYPLNVTAIPTKAVWPYAQQWNLGIQREIAPNVIADLAYVGTKGTHLTAALQLNQLPPLPSSENPFGPNEPLTVAECQSWTTSHPSFALANGTVVTSQSPAYPYLEVACQGIPGLPNVNAVRGPNGTPMQPYPGLGKIYALQNVANSSYNALQFRLQRTRGALTGGITYVYSHSIDDSSDRSDPVLVNSYDLQSNRASSDFDQRHSLTFNYVYKVPSLRNFFHYWTYDVWRTPTCQADDLSSCPEPPKPSSSSGRWGRFVFEGWELAGVTSYVSGTPFTVINSAGNTGIAMTDNAGVNAGFGIAASYPDVAPNMTCTFTGSNPQSFGPLLGNPCQFVAPRGLTFGDAGRNYLNNPGRFNTDISVLKHYRVTESSMLEFRAEAFNVFNNTQFRIYDPDNPGSSGNNVISCYAGPNYSAGYQGSGANCINGASFLHPINAHRPRTMQFALKYNF
jgi:hypothetical protein